MTFYEAALRILESEGRPLHFLEITEKSIAQNLLSHVGKMPEQTMLSRLAAMAKRTRDRRVMVTAKDTFALTDWALPEDAEALARSGGPEENEEDALPPLRPIERHPEARSDLVRSAGRGEHKRRGEEEDGRGRRRRYPPVAEVAFELLTEAGEGLLPALLLERARSRELVSDELSADAMLTALLEDNQRRIDAGRRPQFLFGKETGTLTLERAGSAPEAPPLELQAAFAEALGIPLEGGRPVLPSLGAPPSAQDVEIANLFAAAKGALKDARRACARLVRQHLAQVEAATLEKATVRMLHGLAFRELKVAKRSKDGPLLTARKREGSVELRYAIRVGRGSGPLDRRAVQDLRRDLGHYAAQVGILLSPQEVRGDAKSEAQAAGSLVMLWCGDALGEKFLEAKAGVRSVSVELYELDEHFFEEAKRDGEAAQRRREERHRERAPQARAAASDVPAERADYAEAPKGDAEPDPKNDDPLEAAHAFVGTRGEGAAGEAGPVAGDSQRRRRRRRRGRRGRGPRPEGAEGASPAHEASPGPRDEAAPEPPPGGGSAG